MKRSFTLTRKTSAASVFVIFAAVIATSAPARAHHHHSPHSGAGGDLQGYCADDEHSQFAAAKAFAYSSTGLDLSGASSTDWALKYNATHRCGTIGEFQSRFEALQEFGYSPTFLNLSRQEAIRYAEPLAELQPAWFTRARMALFVQVKDFFYNPQFLNDSDAVSTGAAREWVERGDCGDESQVAYFKQVYEREYHFSYDPSGLNRSSQESKAYAIAKLTNVMACGDLLR